MTTSKKAGAYALATREGILDAELSPGMARLNRFARRVAEGVAVEPDDLAAIASAFRSIVAGANAKEALGLSGKQSQGRRALTGRETEKWFECAYRIEELRRDEKLSLDDAIDKVVIEQPVGRDSAKRWHRKYRKTALSVLRHIKQFEEEAASARAFEAAWRKKST